MSIPPWFSRALAECESLSLDVASDRRKLWSAVWQHLPSNAIEATIAEAVESEAPGPAEVQVARIHAAVIAALTEA